MGYPIEIEMKKVETKKLMGGTFYHETAKDNIGIKDEIAGLDRA